MKIKVLKVISLMLISTFVLSVAVLPCFAYGVERDPYNAIISNSVLPTSLNWDVTFDLEGFNSDGDSVSSRLNFKLDPVFPMDARSSFFSSTTQSAISDIYMGDAIYDNLQLDLYTRYTYDEDDLGLVDIDYSWSTMSSSYNFGVFDVQFHARQFYYTYQSDVVPYLDVPSPFQFFFEGATSVTTQVYYHELGNDVDLLTVSFTAPDESALTPDLFGYSEDESFTLFIDSVVVIVEYDDLFSTGLISVEYAYDGAYCEFSRAADLNTHVTSPSDAVFADYTSWIGLAVSGFLEFQVFPGFSFGALLMVIISFSTVMWFLKLFAGG